MAGLVARAVPTAARRLEAIGKCHGRKLLRKHTSR